MKWSIATGFLTVLILVSLLAGPVDADEVDLIEETIHFRISVEGIMVTTTIDATYMNDGLEDITYPFRVASYPGTFITGLSINDEPAHIVESMYDSNGEPTPSDERNGSEDPMEVQTKDDTGPSEYIFNIEIPAETEVTIAVTMESRLHMENGRYSFEVPFEVIPDYPSFKSVSVLFTGGQDNYYSGRKISFEGSTFSLSSIRTLLDGITYGSSSSQTTPGDAVVVTMDLDEEEGWYQAYFDPGSSPGHYIIAISPYRNNTTTRSRVVSYDTNLENGGIIEEELDEIKPGKEAIICGAYQSHEGELTIDLVMESMNGTYSTSISRGGPDVHSGGWINRYWQLAWMENLLRIALLNNGANGTIDDVVQFSIDRSILSPYTRFEMDLTKDSGTEVDDGEFSDLGGGNRAVPTISDDQTNLGDPWDGWEEFWPDEATKEFPQYSEETEKTFLEKYGLVIGISLFLMIGLIFGTLLYSRLREDDLLKQENRKKIYDYVMENKGAHFREIQRGVELEVGTLSHHLNILEKEQMIISEQDGNNRRFYVAGVQRETGKIRLSRIQENILKEIQAEPGITQVQIARRLGVSRKVVFYHVKFLANSEMVMEEKVKRRAHYYPTD